MRLSGEVSKVAVQETLYDAAAAVLHRSCLRRRGEGDGSQDRPASPGEQMLATPLFAGMTGSEKNRCLFRGARRGTSGGDPKPILTAAGTISGTVAGTIAFA